MGYGDFGLPYLIGIGTDEVEARKILNKYCNRRGIKIIDLGNNKFRDSRHSPESNETDYYIEEVSVNKII